MRQFFGTKPHGALAGGHNMPTTTLKEAENLGGAGKIRPVKVYDAHVAEGSFRGAGSTDALKKLESTAEQVQEGLQGSGKLGGVHGESGLAKKIVEQEPIQVGDKTSGVIEGSSSLIKNKGLLSQQAIDEGIQWVMKNTNKVDHIFKNMDHLLDPLVQKLGGQEATIF